MPSMVLLLRAVSTKKEKETSKKIIKKKIQMKDDTKALRSTLDDRGLARNMVIEGCFGQLLGHVFTAL